MRKREGIITKFGPWLPDHADFEQPGNCSEALNVLPHVSGYEPFRDLTKRGSLTFVVNGALSAETSGVEGALNFAGTKNFIYLLKNHVWSNVTRAPFQYETTEWGWSFAEFGNQVIAANYNDPIQIYDEAAGGRFRDVQATPYTDYIDKNTKTNPPPRALLATPMRDFVVLAHLHPETENQRGVLGPQAAQTVWWSAINDANSWPLPGSIEAQAQNSDMQTLLNDHGPIMGLAGAEDYALVFQQRAITRMHFTGGGVQFQLQTASNDVGLFAPRAFAQYQGGVFFLSESGFYLYQNGLQPIGQNQVDNYFLSKINFGRRHEISCAVDTARNLVFWALPIGERGQEIAVYNWSVQRWSHVQPVSRIRQLTNYLIDDFNPTGYAFGNKQTVGAFDDRGRFGTFSGQALPATIRTSLGHPTSGRRTMGHEIRPLIEGGKGMSLTYFGRDHLHKEERSSEPTPLNKFGTFTRRFNSRFLGLELSIKNGFEHAIGLEINPTSRGRH